MLRRSFLPAFLFLCSNAMAAPPKIAEAKKFIEDAEGRLLTLNADSQRADWVKSTYITDDTEGQCLPFGSTVKTVVLQLSNCA